MIPKRTKEIIGQVLACLMIIALLALAAFA